MSLDMVSKGTSAPLGLSSQPVSAVSAAGLTPRFVHCFCPAPTQRAEDNALRANIGKYGLSHVTKTIDAKEVLDSKAISGREGRKRREREREG